MKCVQKNDPSLNKSQTTYSYIVQLKTTRSVSSKVI